MNKQVFLISGVVLVLAVGAYFFLMRPQTQPATQTQLTPTQTESPSTEPESTSSSDAAGTINSVELKVESQGLKFTPNQLKVKAGEKVRLTYKNTMGQHDLTIDEFNVKIGLLKAGEEGSAEFVADKKGTFEFYCSVAGHRQAGMKGTLVVE